MPLYARLIGLTVTSTAAGPQPAAPKLPSAQSFS
jgi:hypothetical protein